MDAARMLRMARRRAGLSQRALARRSGVAQSTISRIERSLESPSIDTFAGLIEACGLALDLAERPGQGVDRSQIQEFLRATPAERADLVEHAARELVEVRSRARVVA